MRSSYRGSLGDKGKKIICNLKFRRITFISLNLNQQQETTCKNIGLKGFHDLLEVAMDSSVVGSAPNLYTQQSQSIDIPSAAGSEAKVSRSLETLLPSPDSFNSEQGPDDKKAADRAIHSQSGSDVRPQLASIRSMSSILDSLSPIAATLPARISAYDANISDSEPEVRSQALQTSQVEPLPEANAAASNLMTESSPAGKVTTGSNPEKERTSVTNENPEAANMVPPDLQKDRSRASGILDFFRSCCRIQDRHASHPPPRPGV